MRIILEKEAYRKFDEDAKSKGTTTRLLGAKILNEYVAKIK